MTELPDIVGAAEACDILKVSSGNLLKDWTGMQDLPCVVLTCGRVWLRSDVERLAAERHRERLAKRNRAFLDAAVRTTNEIERGEQNG